MGEPDVVTYPGMPTHLDLSGGVVLRPFAESDLDQLVAVINAELDHLRPWMPWASSPVTAETQREFLQASGEQWTAATDFVFGVFRGEDILGGCGLHSRRGPGVLGIGYWLRSSAVGQGLMTAASRRLTAVAASYDAVREIVICCDEANLRSAAVPQRLGFRLVAVEEREALAASETGWLQVWSLAADVARGWVA